MWIFPVIFGGGFSRSSEAQARDWQPKKTWVFVVGTLEWKDSESLASFDPLNRRDAELVEFFKTQGVPAAQMVYLQDKQATTRRIQDSLAQLLSRTAEGDLLFLYYCGHGYKDDDGKGYFASYNTGENVEGWAISSIPATIEEHFKGSRAIVTADCCYSGALAKEVKKQAGQIDYAVFTSSSASEISTGNWTFTEALLDGLRGSAGCDLDDDGHITVEELGRYIVQDMAVGEEQLATILTTGAFSPQTKLAQASAKSDPRVGRWVEVKWEGKFYDARITDVKEDQYKIHWLGFRDYADEWVDTQQVRFPGAQPAAKPAFAPGEAVEVKWKNKWYPAKVLEVKGKVYSIHYTDYGEEWDEWVSSRRIRKPKG